MIICIALYISVWTLLYLGDLEVIFWGRRGELGVL